jgi:hypothetical protein
MRKGANWLKVTLVQCGLAAASLLTAIYHMLKDGATGVYWKPV